MTEKISEAQVGFTTAQQTAINSGVTSEDVTKARGALQTSDIVNNLTSTETNKGLSANMGKELSDRLDNVEGRGRFLSNWNCATGLPASNPPTSPYTYKAGDYYLVSVVSETTNYRPDGTSYTTGVPSTTVETEAVKVKDEYTFDGTVWVHKSVASSEVPFGSLTGQPTDNSNLAAALAAKQDKLTAGNGVKINSANVISIKPTYNSLTSDQKTTLLSTGMYEGDEVISGTIFETDAGKFEKFTKTLAPFTLSWESYANLPVTGYWVAGYGNGKYIAVNNTSADAAYSTDGINWTATTLPESSGWYAVAYGNGVYVAIAYGKTYAAYSTDGINWIETSVPVSSNFFKCVYGNGRFVAVSDALAIMYSTDGINWQLASSLSATGDFNDICYANGLFVVVGRNGIWRSTDGDVWTKASTSAIDMDMEFVAHNGSEFFVYTWDSRYTTQYVRHSSDGITWTDATAQFPGEIGSAGLNKSAFVNGVMVFAGWYGVTTSSTDGFNWSYSNTQAGSAYGLCASDTHFLILADNSKVVSLASADILYNYSMTDLSYNKSELYNKTEVDTALGAKQGTLTAGANISIDSNNVISATGGGSGASSLTDIAVAGTNVTFENGPYKDFNTIGTLTFNNGVVSGFNSTNYIETKEALPSSITSFEMTMKFKTPSTINTSLVYPFLSKKGASTYIGIQGSTSKLVHSTGSLTGTTTLTANTEYTLKIKLENGYYNYYIDNVLQFSYSSLIYAGYVMEVGISKNYATDIGDGSIDLNNTSITIDGDAWWTPLQDIGTKKIINSTGITNTATGNGSLTLQGNASTANYSVNIGESSKGYSYGTALGNSAIVSSNYGVSVGHSSAAQRIGGVALGTMARASSGGTGSNAISIGYRSTAGAGGAIMLGCGTNSEAKTFKVALNDTNIAATSEATGLYTLLQADGTIPAGRVSNILEVVATLPATPVAGKIYFVTGS